MQAKGIDVKGLTDPLGANDLDIDVTDSMPLGNSADDISLAFPFSTNLSETYFNGGGTLEKQKSFSFSDLLKSYKAVPQVINLYALIHDNIPYFLDIGGSK